jgi:hypothetical protein
METPVASKIASDIAGQCPLELMLAGMSQGSRGCPCSSLAFLQSFSSFFFMYLSAAHATTLENQQKQNKVRNRQQQQRNNQKKCKGAYSSVNSLSFQELGLSGSRGAFFSRLPDIRELVFGLDDDNFQKLQRTWPQVLPLRVPKVVRDTVKRHQNAKKFKLYA